MAHYRPRPNTGDSAQRHLLDDARLLIHRYEARNVPGVSLDPDQRREWAAQAVEALERLSHELAARIGPPDDYADRERRRVWMEQFHRGERIPKPLPDKDLERLRKRDRPLWQRAFKPD